MTVQNSRHPLGEFEALDMALLMLFLAYISGAAGAYMYGAQATPTSCEPCVRQKQVWCYHDDICYPHGSSADQAESACPGKKQTIISTAVHKK